MPDGARMLAQGLPLLDGKKFSLAGGSVPDDKVETIISLHLTPSSAFPGSSLRPDGIDNIRAIDDQMGADA